jgi:hypothetical protein
MSGVDNYHSNRFMFPNPITGKLDKFFDRPPQQMDQVLDLSEVHVSHQIRRAMSDNAKGNDVHG